MKPLLDRSVEFRYFRSDQSSLDFAVKNARAQVRQAVQDYAHTNNELAFGGSMLAALEQGHTRAALIGRRRAGDLAPLDADDKRFGSLQAREDMRYLRNFLEDLSIGKYVRDDGSLNTGRIERRALLYPQGMTGTANETFVLASNPETLWTWKLGPVTAHCEDCPSFAAGSPYRSAELPAYPGDGSTACLFNCGCELFRDDGLTGFTTVAMDGEGE
jgi:hypothetical protein